MTNPTTKNLISFIKNSPSVFHVVHSIKKILLREGFVEIHESEPYELTSAGKYFVTRNGTSIIAFKIGELLDQYSFNIVASHGDSPSFKVKPNSDFINDEYHRLNIEAYGGMLCSTWFDRPLSIAGRVIIKDGSSLVNKLIDFDKNLLSIPSVAIHFDRKANENATYSLAVDMFPTLSQDKDSLKSLIAKQLDCIEEDVINYDLFLYNRQEGYFWGQNEEFFSSCKIDNLQCAYTTLMGFLKSENKRNVSVYCCFDNEEVGSSTMQGADSSFLEDTLLRISNSLNKTMQEHQIALANSFMVSADNGHAVHPNHPELTDQLNRVYLNKGVVIKFNAAQSYTSDSLSSSIFMNICKNADVPYQVFTNKSGIRGGSTLGNISTRHVSINSVDIGLPQLAMHSCMETAGVEDNIFMVKAIKEYFDSVIIINNERIQIIK